MHLGKHSFRKITLNAILLRFEKTLIQNYCMINGFESGNGDKGFRSFLTNQLFFFPALYC